LDQLADLPSNSVHGNCEAGCVNSSQHVAGKIRLFGCMACMLLIDAIYDITIAYKLWLLTFVDNVYGISSSEVHIHINSIQVS